MGLFWVGLELSGSPSNVWETDREAIWLRRGPNHDHGTHARGVPLSLDCFVLHDVKVAETQRVSNIIPLGNEHGAETS
jgi:hypothetical protein